MRFLLLGVALALAAAGCGQKGVLYLRDHPPPGVKPERPERAKPVPYPRAGRDEPGQKQT